MFPLARRARRTSSRWALTAPLPSQPRSCTRGLPSTCSARRQTHLPGIGDGAGETRLAQGPDEQGAWTVSDHVPLAWTPSVTFCTPATRGQGERRQSTGKRARTGRRRPLPAVGGSRWAGAEVGGTENGLAAGRCMSLVWKGSQTCTWRGDRGMAAQM